MIISTLIYMLSLVGLFPVGGIGDVSNNYWGGGAISTDANTTNSDPADLSAAPTIPGATCGDGLEFTHKGDPVHSYGILAYDTNHCKRLAALGQGLELNGLDSLAYDTLRRFVEECPEMPHAYEAFGTVLSAVSTMPGPSTKWLDLRNWLFKVLYLNRDTMWYCSDAVQMLSTFLYEGPRGYDIKGKIAVEQYLLSSGKCPDLVHSMKQYIEDLKVEDHQVWKDSVRDSIAYPYDSTHIPTLQEIGFGLLLGPEAAVGANGTIPSRVFGTISASPNPFKREASIEYTLNVPATLTVEVYDVLGRKKSALVPSVFTSNGEGTLTLGSDLPPGTYFVRFSVPEGEVRTVKLVKE